MGEEEVNDNEIMKLAATELPKHKMPDIFSYRYAFLLGWKAKQEDSTKWVKGRHDTT